MSEQYPGGFISKTPPTPDGTTAQGMWTLSQAAGYQKQGLWPVPYIPQYIEDMFSTWLYTGNGSTQTITNNIDLAGKGGLVWCKSRSNAVPNYLQDSARSSFGQSLVSEETYAQFSTSNISSVTSTGFNVGSNVNISGQTLVSWTFRKQPKFFDCVTYTGNGLSAQQIAHSLGSIPGCVIVKPISTTGNWGVWHRGNGTTDYTGLSLNQTTAAQDPGAGFYAGFTSTYFSPRLVEDGSFNVGNLNGVQYVAYLFAHNAGGFGLTGTDNVISCGSYTGNGSATGPVIDLGYEPQWLLVKNASAAWGWVLVDNMRGLPVGGTGRVLNPNTGDPEGGLNSFNVSATGFSPNSAGVFTNTSGETYIYIAIRRGPMKVPTSGTSVFSPITANSPTGTKLTTNFPVDLSITQERATAGGAYWMDRLRGALSPGQTGTTPYLQSSNTGAETLTTITNGWDNTGLNVAYFGNVSAVWWNLRRAPSFFDEVCYTGTGGASQTFTHNLGVAPELVIVKNRDAAAAWESLGTALSSSQRQIYLNRTAAGVAVASGHLGWNGTDGAYKAPTSTVVYFGGDSDVGGSGVKYVAYLFATCAGVSKVGSYTGTGAAQTINCGFTAGSRFVLIKRTDSTGDWYVWDSARGIVSGNDPYLLLNSTAAEVTTTDYVDTAATGFEISSTAPAAINASGGTFIFLAIA